MASIRMGENGPDAIKAGKEKIWKIYDINLKKDTRRRPLLDINKNSDSVIIATVNSDSLSANTATNRRLYGHFWRK